MPHADETPTVAGYDLTGEVLRRLGKRGEFEEELPFNVTPRRLLIDAAGNPQGFDVTLRWAGDRNQDVTIPARILGAARKCDVLAELEIHVLPEIALKLCVFLQTIAMGFSGGVPYETIITRAEWRDGRLLVPGRLRVADWKPDLAAYGDVRGDEAEARRAWARIAELARESYRSVIVTGMPIGSIYSSIFKADSFAMHITAESSVGKTESAEIAMSALGDARRPHGPLYRTWDASPQAPTNLVKMIGPLPAWLDETAAFGDDSQAFTKLIFRLAQGRGRLIADTEGGLVRGSGDRWDACILSTGEARVSNQSGLTGLRRRVLEVYAPLTTLDAHSEMLALARDHHGWPLLWLADDPRVDETFELYLRLFNGAASLAAGQQVEVAQASSVALCAAGFGTLARLAGAPVSPAELQEAVNRMFAKLLAAAEEEGADVGERAVRAIREAVLTRGTAFTSPEEPIDGLRERWGVLFPDGCVGIIGEATLKKILLEFGGITDSQPPLEKLSDRGTLRHDPGKYVGKRKIFVPGRGVITARLYIFAIGSDRVRGGPQ